MNQLPKTEAEAVKKMSTTRLVSKLTKAGYVVEDIEQMNRESMMETWATCIINGTDKQAAEEATGIDNLERERLDFEKKKFEAEQTIRLRETALKEAELKILQDKYKAEQDEKKSVVLLAKRYGEAIKASVTPMGPHVLDVVSFFKHIEVVFDNYEVPVNLRASLLQPYLNEKARSVVARMDPTKCNDYKTVRDVILKEHKLSPCAYLDLFNTLSQSVSETTVMYCARLKSLLKMYVESRNVKDFDSLISLLVCDRIKSTLSDGCLRHILSVEAANKQGWLGDNELAECIDLYKANHLSNDKPRAGAIGGTPRPTAGAVGNYGNSQTQKSSHSFKSFSAHNTVGQFKPSGTGNAQSNVPKGPNANVVCYKCRQTGHTRKHCPLLTQASDHCVNFCSLQSPHMDVQDQTCVGNFTNTIHSKQHVSLSNVVDKLADECTDIERSTAQGQVVVDTAVVADKIPCSNYVDSRESYRDFVSLQYVNVTIDELNSDGNVVSIRAVADSGSEVCVVKSCFVESIVLPKVGTVRLRGIVGDPVEADLVKLHISLVDGDSRFGLGGNSIPVMCAVCSDLNEDMILTTALVEQLQCVHSTTVVNTLHCDSVVETDRDNIQSCVDVDVRAGCPQQQVADGSVTDEGGETDSGDSICNNDSDWCTVNADVFRFEQQNDASLKKCWVLAEKGKGGFVVRDGLLYHQEKVDSVGEKCFQLCLPTSRRKSVLELAHCTVGCHQAYRRTRDRIRLSFFWPTISADVRDYCSRCEVCQKTARVTVWDRTPITAVPRAQYAFQQFYVDCAGPLFPNQKTSAYNYFIVLCDSATSFPFAYPLRALTAKNIADALIKTWTLTGVPETIIWDNATPHKSQLMRELMKRMACVPRFSTPYHPEGHSPAERLISTIKTLISKVAVDKPKQWHLYLDFILWAIRESENESLGVAPWTLVFSRLPRGPLSVLKESWEGVIGSPLSLGKNTLEFLRDLQSKLETAREYALEHNAQASQRYVNRYNLRARPKSFMVGDQVLLLTPDTTAARTFSHWRGPARVVEVRSPHSYVVELDDVHHHVHANRLKQFLVASDSVTCVPDFETVCINNCVGTDFETIDDDKVHIGLDHNCYGCAVISDADSDFGEVQTFHQSKVKSELLPSQKIASEQIAHLSADEQQRLLQLLDKYSECFSDDPGLCILVHHEINLMPEFKPKRLKAYRVPERLKSQVSSEIQHMLDLGIIRPSNSDMVSPLVVVLKGPGGRDGIRLAVDYSYVNRFTRNDPFPVSDIEGITHRISGSKLMSSFDAAQGYFQTPVRVGDEPLTAFVCDDGIFEFVRTPFGGKACGSTFIRAVEQVLKPIRGFTESYVDDMIVHTHAKNGGSVFDMHLQQIERFLQRIRETGLTLKLRKCKFAHSEIKFCGKIIGSGGKRPDPEKVAAIQGLNPAKTKTEVRRLLGIFGFFRDHIPGYAALARPLTELTTKRIPNVVPWKDEHTTALNHLKHALCEATNRKLYAADFSKPFCVHVDASDFTVAGYLSQCSEDNVEYPLAFFSVKLNASQKAWAIVHKEAYAVLVALKKFRNLVWGAEIHLFSDHNPLSFLSESAPKNAKLMRWCLALQEFNIAFHYVRGQSNVVPDCLSRLNSDE